MKRRTNHSAWPRVLILLALAAGLFLLYRATSSPPSASTPSASRLEPPVRFENQAAQSGLNYKWSITGPRPLNILQTIGNGCAFLDYDNDGNLDILLVGPRLALYRGDGHGRFTDVTRPLGLDAFQGNFLGCAVGDYDNDGYDDLYISGYRTGLLLHNRGGKSFKNVAKEAGLKPQPWGTSCAFADLDGDGCLDLYIADYVDFGPRTQPQICSQPATVQYIQAHNSASALSVACSPTHYRSLKGVLYRNLGGARFIEVTASWVVTQSGNGLGVAAAPFDASGRLGFAIANDLQPGDLFRNDGQGRLANIGKRSGTAFHRNGKVHSGMGMDWGDYDNDGKQDLFVATFSKEAKDLYHNDGQDVFSAVSGEESFGLTAFNCVTFGCKWLDADNDGWLDLMLANGDVADNIHDIDGTLNYREPTLFLYNSHSAALRDVSQAVGFDKLPDIVGRGLAVGDYDNDGRVDALVVDSEGPPLLLQNESVHTGHWLSLRLQGSQSNRDGYGALVAVTAGGLTQTRLCHADGSYLSSSDKRVHVGLGQADKADKVVVRWPSGHTDVFLHVQADREMIVREGESLGPIR